MNSQDITAFIQTYGRWPWEFQSPPPNSPHSSPRAKEGLCNKGLTVEPVPKMHKLPHDAAQLWAGGGAWRDITRREKDNAKERP